MSEFNKFVGLDVHKSTIAISIASDDGAEVRYFGEIKNTKEALINFANKISQGSLKLSFCYEAGGCGYEVYRHLRNIGHDCMVVAPSLIPKKAGQRVKTDRRDSLNLARLHRAGELTGVWVPDAMNEALRDLTRAREDMKHLQRQAKQRLLAFLLRHGWTYSGKSNWTKDHFNWLETVKFQHAAQQIVFQEYVDTVKYCGKRVESVTQQIEICSRESACWPVIESLMALKGIDLITAATIMAEIGDLTRFDSAPKLMSYLGLVPSEHSSGSSVRRGGITKTGNSHVRRVLVEAAWTYRFPARKTAHTQKRAKVTTEAVQEISWNAQKRLCQRYKELNANGKIKVQTCTAVARELAGFVWAIGQTVPLKPTAYVQ